MRIAVLPTGKLEWHGLGKSLSGLFPEHEFVMACEEGDLDDGGRIHSATSSDVTLAQWEKVDKDGQRIFNDAERLISAAAGAALGDTRREAADLVLIVDDVELVNMHQVGLVIEMMRRAARSHLGFLNPGRSARVAKTLRDKVSFHLVKPMIEAWFFASKSSLEALPIRRDRAPELAPRDVEDFESTDLAYLHDHGAECARWQELHGKWARQARRRSNEPKLAWDRQNRARHPKGYLSWLCWDSGAKNCSAYAETSAGTAALLAMNWQELLGRSRSAPYARALVEDIAAFLGVPEPFPDAQGEVLALSNIRNAPRDRLLRNI